MRFSSLVPALLLLAGCATPAQVTVDPSRFYDRNLQLTVNGLSGVGTLVVPRAQKYDIKIHAQSDMDFLLIRSCHGVMTREREGENFQFTYVPMPNVEDNRACPVTFMAIEKDKNRRPLGWLDFQDPRTTLPARLRCNWVVTSFPGVSACGTGKGLVTRIEFDQPVNVSVPDPACRETVLADGKSVPTFTTKDQKAYEFNIPRGGCTVEFKAIGQDLYHRLSTYGWDEILPEKI